MGVQLEDGRIIHADHIVSTIDPKVAMNELVGMDQPQQLNRKYARW